jgi:hypothetical protein
MAQSITDPAGKRPRGRPRKNPISGTPGERAAADATAQAIIEGKAAPAPAAASTGKTHTGPPAADPGKTAKGFGANEVTQPVFLSHVQALNRLDDEKRAAQEVVKAINGKIKDQRQLAKADGIVLGELDEAVKDAKTERVDLVAKEERRRTYREWLGLPLVQGDLFEYDKKLPTLEQDRAKWRAIGNTDGRMGRDCRAPDHCPKIHIADYEHAWSDGQKALMQESPLTAGAFNEDGSVKETAKPDDQVETWDPSKVGQQESTPAAPAAPAPAEAIVVFKTEDFLDTVQSVDDCSKATLSFAESKRRWEAADRVVVLFKGEDGVMKKRILKAPEENGNPAYEDLGEPNGELTDAEEIPEETVEEFLDGLVAAGKAEEPAAEEVEHQAEAGEGQGGEFE